MPRPPHHRSISRAAAALLALGLHSFAPAASADPSEGAAMCSAKAQRDRLAGTPEMIEDIQRRIAAQAKPGQKIVALSNSGYSYSAPSPGAEAAALAFEAQQLEASTPAR